MTGHPRRGFTLIELIIVIVVLGILAALATGTFRSATDNAKTRTLTTSLTSLDRLTRTLAASSPDTTLGSHLTAAAADLPPGTAVSVYPTFGAAVLQQGDTFGKLVLPRTSSTAPSTLTTYLRPVSLYSATVLDSKPLLYWRLDETSGQFLDSSGNNRHAAIIGTPTFAQGGATPVDANTSADFTGPSTGPFARTSLTWNNPDAFSYEAWIYPTAPRVSAADGIIVGRSGYNSPRLTWGVPSSSTTSIHWLMGVVSGGAVGLVSPTLPLSTWHHVAITTVGMHTSTPTSRLYVNGTQVAATTFSSALVPPLDLVAIGVRDSATGFPGRLDEIAVYDRALTAAEISEHYTAATATP